MSNGKSEGTVIEPGPPEVEQGLDELMELIEEGHRFLVVAHISPDGDAVGSTLALKAILENQGKEVIAYNRDEVPYNLRFLPGSNDWVTEIGQQPIDGTILLDCGTPKRIGEEFPERGWGTKTVVIDHHETYDPDFADIYIRDTEAAATGELLYRLAQRYEDTSIEVAKNVYCCLMTDTGGFRYSNTSRTAFRMAGELVDRGVGPWEMSSEIYENEPKERLELLSQVLQTLALSDCQRLAFLRVTRSMVASVGSDEDLTDGFINYARSISGVEVATQMREVGDEQWRVSFRSRGKVNVARLAEVFGGGGHHNAAGCEIAGKPAEIEEKLSEALVELLDESYEDVDE